MGSNARNISKLVEVLAKRLRSTDDVGKMTDMYRGTMRGIGEKTTPQKGFGQRPLDSAELDDMAGIAYDPDIAMAEELARQKRKQRLNEVIGERGLYQGTGRTLAFDPKSLDDSGMSIEQFIESMLDAGPD
jgi:hypothetical protein